MKKNLLDISGIENDLKRLSMAVEDRRKLELKKSIVIKCMSFVTAISSSLARRSTDPKEDILQVGFLGLLKAIDSYDVERGSSFRQYCTHFIVGEIKHYIRDKVLMIKPPRSYSELAYKIVKLSDNFKRKYGKEPSNIELAKEFDISVKDICIASEIERRKTIYSLDSVDDKLDFNWYDKLTDIDYKEIENIEQNRLELKLVLEKCDDETKEIIRGIFFEDLTQKEIALKLGISQMQISRKIKRILMELFEELKED